MARFLSDEWFSRTEELTKAAGDSETARAMKAVVVNLTILSGTREIEMCLDRGIIRKGHTSPADVQKSMSADYAYKLLVAGDWSIGMKGYIAHKIKVSGNMKKLIPLQLYKPSADQENLRTEIEKITEQE
ncbi:hypothetical protein LCGC14_2723350 [marine sediment metagenome]|uniref:SCP2 domain-containing protein n=1 Tax=marine sediment metagenome TaxID=412755 RepID=A0A0F8Z9L4_9ZZZZ|nr:hypothetical protein [Spirochaetota bacterium]